MTRRGFKNVPPKRISFVAAVTKYGDHWALAVPLFLVGTEDVTMDAREFRAMARMERGQQSRIGHDFDVVNG